MSARGHYTEDLNDDIRSLLGEDMPTAQIARICHCEIATVERIRMSDCPTERGRRRFEDELLYDSPGQWRLPSATARSQIDTIAACWEDCLAAGKPSVRRAMFELKSIVQAQALADGPHQQLASLVREWEVRSITDAGVGRRLDELIAWLDSHAVIESVEAPRRRRAS